ncbi:hypothetical protein ADUPG1_005508, partial [Aduncisulcus paluster]
MVGMALVTGNAAKLIPSCRKMPALSMRHRGRTEADGPIRPESGADPAWPER